MSSTNDSATWIVKLQRIAATVAKAEFCPGQFLGTWFSVAAAVYSTLNAEHTWPSNKNSRIASTVLFLVIGTGQIASSFYMIKKLGDSRGDKFHAAGLMINGCLNSLTSLVYFLPALVKYQDQTFQNTIRTYSFGILMAIFALSEIGLLTIVTYARLKGGAIDESKSYKFWRGAVRGGLMVVACGFASAFGFTNIEWLSRVTGGLRAMTAMVWVWSLWFETRCGLCG